jgi:hypothetical protein
MENEDIIDERKGLALARDFRKQTNVTAEVVA